MQIQLSPGAGAAGGVHLLLATLSATSPGFQWQPGFSVPINVDFLTQGFVNQPNSGFLNGFLNGGLGVFDVAGNATATLTVPPALLQPLVGSQVHWSYIAADLSAQPMCVGEAKSLLVF